MKTSTGAIWVPDEPDLDAMHVREPEWRHSPGFVDYPFAVAEMERRAALIGDGLAPELIWLLEHPPLYTAGTSAVPEELLDAERFAVFKSGRGGRYTYHGPGQRVVYCMLDLGRRGRDLRRYVRQLEEWIILTLDVLGIEGERREGRVGIWVAQADGREEKIAALGVRVRRWVSFHGFALNVDPDMTHFSSIIPCGVAEHGVTSIKALGRDVSMDEVDEALRASFGAVFNG